jgi:hypothetical protein
MQQLKRDSSLETHLISVYGYTVPINTPLERNTLKYVLDFAQEFLIYTTQGN